MRAAASRRRSIALLSVLAASDVPVSRDKIVGLLWPDAGEEQARHSLTQVLYLTRQALRSDDVLLIGAEVALNSDRIACDVREFDAALAKGESERAVALYRGPFLDGFFLPGASEFEHWLTAQRSRLEDGAVRALESLAQRADADADHSSVIAMRKRIAALRPLDSAATLNLMRALAAAGDRAGALQHAHVHERLLRDQLDLDPGAQVSAYAAELRAAPVLVPAGEKRNAAIAAAEPAALRPEVTHAGTDFEASVRARPAPAPRMEVWVARPSGRRRLLGSVGVAAVLVTIGILIGRGRQASDRLDVLAVPQQVVVAPFRVAGASTALGYLREGLVELLSTRLASDTAARSADAGAVLGAWRRAGLITRTEVPRETVVELAGRLGAKRVVVGNVVGARSRAMLSATVLGVPGGAVEGEATVEGPADSIAALVDQLAARLLASQAGEDVRLADRTTESLPALRAYLQGQASYREASYAAALRSYSRALDLDRTFALAALRLAVSADRLNDVQQQRRALAIAWNHREKLDERELAHLTALAGPRYPNASSAAEQLKAWEQLVTLAPDRAEAWYELGARLFRDGATLGIADAHSRAVVAFQRALVIDPTFQLARQFLLQLGAHSVAGLERPGLSVLESNADSLGPLAPFIRWRLALAGSDSALLRRLRDTLPQLGPVNLRTIAMASAFDGVGLRDGRAAADALLQRATKPYEKMDAHLALHSLALLEGRPSTALQITEGMSAAEPGIRTHQRMRVLDAVYAEGDSTAATLAAVELERLARGERTTGSAGPVQPTDLCILSQWRLTRRDTAGLAELIARLRTPGFDDASAYLNTPAAVCADLIAAALAVRTRGRAALPDIQQLDALALSAAVAADLSNYAHLLIARLYRDVGEPAMALAAIRRRPYMAGWPRYLATAWREEGLLAEAVGDRSGALHAYQRFLALRTAPERALEAQVVEIRARVGALQ